MPLLSLHERESSADGELAATAILRDCQCNNPDGIPGRLSEKGHRMIESGTANDIWNDRFCNVLETVRLSVNIKEHTGCPNSLD